MQRNHNKNSIFQCDGDIVYKEHTRRPSQDSKSFISRCPYTIYNGLDKLPDSPRFNGQQGGTTLLDERKQQDDYKPPRLG